MSKFGQLIDAATPVLLDFFTEWSEPSTSMHPVLLDVAAAMGDKAKVIKIDVEKNQELAEALRVKGLPTLMIYKNGEMKCKIISLLTVKIPFANDGLTIPDPPLFLRFFLLFWVKSGSSSKKKSSR